MSFRGLGTRVLSSGGCTQHPITHLSAICAALFADIYVTCYDNKMPPRPAPTPRLGRPPTGIAVPAAVRMRHMRQRRKAAGLRAITRWVPALSSKAQPTVDSDHYLHDLRSLAMHALIAAKVERDRTLLAIPQRNLSRWRKRFAAQPARWWQEWTQLLRRPWPDIAATLTDRSESATRLRQSSPFVGILTPTERRRFHDAFRA